MGKKLVLGIFLMNLCFLLTGCNSHSNDLKVEEDEENKVYDIVNIDGITLENKNVTKSGATVIVTDLTGLNNGYTTWRIIQKFDNNEWKTVPRKPPEEGVVYTQTTPVYSVDENGILEFNYNWTGWYGDLEKGKYRIVIEVYLEYFNSSNSENEAKYLATEFVID